jgi:hypothetical protein
MSSYEAALDKLRRRLGDSVENQPDGILLAALESPAVRKRILSRSEFMIAAVHHSIPARDGCYLISIELRALPPVIQFFPTLLTAVLDAETDTVLELFELGEEPVLILGHEDLPHLCKSLTDPDGTVAHQYWNQPLYESLGRAIAPWTTPPPTVLGFLNKMRDAAGRSPYVRLEWAMQLLKKGAFPWQRV